MVRESVVDSSEDSGREEDSGEGRTRDPENSGRRALPGRTADCGYAAGGQGEDRGWAREKTAD